MARETARVGHVLHTEYKRINLQDVMEETKNLTKLPQTWLHQCRWNYKPSSTAPRRIEDGGG
jgi:hypothetical protein